MRFSGGKRTAARTPCHTRGRSMKRSDPRGFYWTVAGNRNASNTTAATEFQNREFSGGGRAFPTTAPGPKKSARPKNSAESDRKVTGREGVGATICIEGARFRNPLLLTQRGGS